MDYLEFQTNTSIEMMLVIMFQGMMDVTGNCLLQNTLLQCFFY